MLDTNICSYIIKHRPVEVLAKFNSLKIDDCCISSITYAELQYWLARNKRLHAKSKNPGIAKINEQVINNFVSHLDIVDFNAHASHTYGVVRDLLDSKGINIGNMDLLIGAHAISLKLILVTNNIKDFKALPNLKLENWCSK